LKYKKGFINKQKYFFSMFRPSLCKYSRIGCCWCGPFHELAEHEIGCGHLMKPGVEIMDSLAEVDGYNEGQLKLYKDIVSLLSREKVTFNGR
jgi:hypothetical protein